MRIDADADRLKLPLDTVQLLGALGGAGPRSTFMSEVSKSTGYPVIDEGNRVPQPG